MGAQFSDRERGIQQKLGETTLLPPGLPEEDGGWMSVAILNDLVMAEDQRP